MQGVNQIWSEAKLRGIGVKRAKTLISAAEHSIRSKEVLGVARM